MTQAEVKQVDESYELYSNPVNRLSIFHNSESGEVIVLVYNPTIVGVTKLKDFLTLNADKLRNIIFWWKGRDAEMFDKVLGLWRTKGVKTLPLKEVLEEPLQPAPVAGSYKSVLEKISGSTINDKEIWH